MISQGDLILITQDCSYVTGTYANIFCDKRHIGEYFIVEAVFARTLGEFTIIESLCDELNCKEFYKLKGYPIYVPDWAVQIEFQI